MVASETMLLFNVICNENATVGGKDGPPGWPGTTGAKCCWFSSLLPPDFLLLHQSLTWIPLENSAVDEETTSGVKKLQTTIFYLLRFTKELTGFLPVTLISRFAVTHACPGITWCLSICPISTTLAFRSAQHPIITSAAAPRTVNTRPSWCACTRAT